MTTTNYQIQRKALEKAQEKYQNLSKEEKRKNVNMKKKKERSDNMVANDIKNL